MTKIPALDQMIGGLNEGGITVISGRRGEGKSTIGNTIMLNAIQQNYSCCAYSGELSSQQFKEWLYLTATESKYVGYKTDERSGKKIAIIDREIASRISDWLSGKMKLFDNSVVFESDQQTAVLKCFEIAARRYGCKLFLLDNLMSLLTTGDEENRAQAKFMATLKAFATKYKVHVLCVCHPRKEKEGTTFSNDTVSGSSVLTNLADNVWSIEKPHIRVTKNRSYGETGFIPCDFDPANRRIFQASLGDRTVYGWDHNGIKPPEHPAAELEEFSLQSSRPEQQPAF
jgi:twinkle protein